MAGAGCGGRGEDLECVHEDVGMLGLHPGWAVFGDMWRDFIWGNV